MTIDGLGTWQSELALLPKVADTSWANNFASWYADRIIGITTDPTKLVPTGFVFTFAQSLFASSLLSLTPTADTTAGITGFANAWETALNATVAVVGPGSFIPPSTPNTLFSVVTTTTIDPASIALGKAKLLELITAPPVADPLSSLFPEKFRDATLLLTITSIGLDSEPIPPGGPGPQPLTAANIPLI
jgi:hypothetical protein